MTYSSSSAAPLLSAGALFVATALASQWLQHRMSGRLEEHDLMNSDVDYSSDEVLRRHRREQHRIRRKRRQLRERKQGDARHSNIIGNYASIDEQEENEFDDGDNGESEEDDGYKEDLDDTTENDYIQQSMPMAPTTQPLNGFDSPTKDQEVFDPYQYPDSISPVSPLNNYRESYKMRRLEDRLSFDNLRPLFQNHVDPLGDTSSAGTPATGVSVTAVAAVLDGTNRSYPLGHTPEQELQEGPTTSPIYAHEAIEPQHSQRGSDNHHNKKKSCAKNRHHRPRGMSVAEREDEADFLPKNSNWNYFERYNEHDVKLGLVVPAINHDGASSSFVGDHQHHQPFSNGYSHEPSIFTVRSKGIGSDPDLTTFDVDIETDMDLPQLPTNQQDDIPDDNSSSSEEQFVWTEAIHAHSKATHRGQIQFTTIGGNNATAAAPRPVSSITADKEILNEGPVSGHVPRTPGPLGGIFQKRTSGERSDVKKVMSLSRSTSYSELSMGSSATPRVEQQHGERQGHAPRQKHNHHRHWYRTARAQYNAKIMPNKVVLIRHGQSMGNIDESLYSTTPDNAMPLTKLGFEQARRAGQNLRDKVLAPGETVHFIVSPYVRTVETFHGIVSAWCDPKSPQFAHIENRTERLKAWYGRLLEMGLTWHEDPRIREQDFGNYQDPEKIRKAKEDRHGFGVFYYRFAHGESASDVFDRVSTFLDSLWRSFDMNRSRNYVLVTHGISIRVLLARYFRFTIHQFNMLANPRNCEMVVMGHDGCGRLRLEGRYQLHLKQRIVEQAQPVAAESTEGEDSAEIEPPSANQNGRSNSAEATKESATSNATGSAGTIKVVTEVGEYKFYKRLRVLPKAAITKVPIRVFYE